MDVEGFTERAALMEFEGGMSRFEAETLAAKAQGLNRWQAMQEVRDAERGRHSAAARDRRPAGERDGAGAVSAVQRRAADAQGRPMPERELQAGRSGLALPSLRLDGRGVL